VRPDVGHALIDALPQFARVLVASDADGEGLERKRFCCDGEEHV